MLPIYLTFFAAVSRTNTKRTLSFIEGLVIITNFHPWNGNPETTWQYWQAKVTQYHYRTLICLHQLRTVVKDWSLERDWSVRDLNWTSIIFHHFTAFMHPGSSVKVGNDYGPCKNQRRSLFSSIKRWWQHYFKSAEHTATFRNIMRC